MCPLSWTGDLTEVEVVIWHADELCHSGVVVTDNPGMPTPQICRVCVQGLRDPWPAVTVGTVGDPEDSFFVDLDGDGVLDIVSSCEGVTQSMFIHWAPSDPNSLLDPEAWTTSPIPLDKDIGGWIGCTQASLGLNVMNQRLIHAGR